MIVWSEVTSSINAYCCTIIDLNHWLNWTIMWSLRSSWFISIRWQKDCHHCRWSVELVLSCWPCRDQTALLSEQNLQFVVDLQPPWQCIQYLDNYNCLINQAKLLLVHAVCDSCVCCCVLDVVYIAAIHPTHVPLSLMMLSAGKHVLCEKPMSLTVPGAKKVIDFAQQKQLLFVEVTDGSVVLLIFILFQLINMEKFSSLRNWNNLAQNLL